MVTIQRKPGAPRISFVSIGAFEFSLDGDGPWEIPDPGWRALSAQFPGDFEVADSRPKSKPLAAASKE